MHFPLSRRRLITASGAAVALAATPARAAPPRLTHGTWGGGVGKTWKESFTEDFESRGGSAVRVVELPNPEAQIRAQASAPQYNTALCTQVQAIGLMNDGLVETFDPAELPEMANVDRKYWLTTDDGKLAGVTTYFAYYGIAVNSRAADVAAFRSWKSLGDARWRGKLSITRPIYLSTYDLPIMAKATGGSEKDPASGMKLLEAAARNTLNVSTSLAQQNAMLLRGEIVAMPFYSVRVWAMREEGNKDIQMVIPEEGALLVPYVVIAPKGVKDREATRQWLNYVASAPPQLRGAESAGYLPANRTAVMSPKVQAQLGANSFEELRQRLYQPDWKYITAQHKHTVEQLEKMLAGIK